MLACFARAGEEMIQGKPGPAGQLCCNIRVFLLKTSVALELHLCISPVIDLIRLKPFAHFSLTKGMRGPMRDGNPPVSMANFCHIQAEARLRLNFSQVKKMEQKFMTALQVMFLRSPVS